MIFVQKYSTIDAILAYIILQLKAKCSQKSMVKLDFSLFEQTPLLGLVSEQCWMYQIILWG